MPPADSGDALKAIFREGWSAPQRVEGWTAGTLTAEFADVACREAWKEALKQAVGSVPLRDALDFGTGPGTIAQLWAELGCVTTGVDFSPGMLEAGRLAAKERGLTISFVEGDAEMPPFSRKRFDVISSRFLIFTLPHPGYAMRRWVEMLRPGGALIFIGHEHTQAMERPRATKAAKSRWQASEQYRDALKQLPFTDHTAAHLRVVMEAVGLKDIERVPVDALLDARASFRKRMSAEVALQTTPYIMVGRK